MCVFVSACLPGGHVDIPLELPGLAMSGTGDGPAVLNLCHVEDRIRSLPTSVDVPVVGDTGCTNAIMQVTAFRANKQIRQWTGPVKWTGTIADGGSLYIGYVGARKAVRWRAPEPGPVRVETDPFGRGGVALADWLPGHATRVEVVVWHGYGDGGGGAGTGPRPGAARHGADRRDGLPTATGRPPGGRTGSYGQAGARAPGAPAGGRAVARSGHAGGAGAASGGPAGAGRNAGARADDGAGRGRGRGASGTRGRGTSPTGAVAGSPTGARRASWSQPPTAEVSRRGGRTPDPRGVEGGSAGGRGEPGDRGLAAGIALFGGVITVPRSLAAALDLAVIMSDGGLSPAALAGKWIKKGLGLSSRQLQQAIEREAAEYAAVKMRDVSARLGELGDYARMAAADQRRVVAATEDAFRREYFERVERGVAREIVRIEDHLARGVDNAWVDRLMREDLASARRVREAARGARKGFRPRVTEEGAKAAPGLGPAGLRQARRDAAARLGFHTRIPPQRAPFNSHGQEVFFDGRRYITADVDGHRGGAWKMFDRRGRRVGTFDANLVRIGP